MADPRHTPAPSRREVLAGAAVAGTGALAATPAEAGTPDTPIMRLFRRWVDIQRAADADEVTLDGASREALYWKEYNEVGDQLLALPVVSAADAVAKIIVETSWFDCGMNPDRPIRAEMLALVGLSGPHPWAAYEKEARA